jgi:hypothetical protein
MQKFFNRLLRWEEWNFYILYLPILPWWLWYCLRSKSVWFFSSSNPTITFGGFEGEGKREMYEQLPRHLYPKTIYIDSSMPEAMVLTQIQEAGFTLPFTVKPDLGMKGILFRRIESWKQWSHYHQTISVDYVVQDWIKHPNEYSIFYYRHPSETKGVISGFIQKDLQQVVGDGVATIEQLVKQHPKASRRVKELKAKHIDNWHLVLNKGQLYYLSYAGNHNCGAQFINLSNEIDEQLHSQFDSLSQSTQFYYGRYDIKANNVEGLKAGHSFSIIEFNGCGAEPNHIYDCGLSLLEAYRILLKHWQALYAISRYNHQQGISYWSFQRGWKFLREARIHFKKLEELDVSGI